jgi:kynurenine formamidase
LVGGELTKTLLDSARNKRVTDLSVVLSIDHPVTWPGKGVSRHRHRYTKNDFIYADNLKLYHHGHVMDSQAGTSLVPPSYALPPEPLLPNALAPTARIWLDDYEREFGPRGTSDTTTEKVPLSQTCGWARVIDVRHLVGSTNRGNWPASPRITVAEIKQYEAANGELQAGQIVVFRTDHTDRHFQPRAEAAVCMADPINGIREGWPAPGPEVIAYLAEKGIRCVATDGPTLGGVDERLALMTYWMLGSRNMVGVEFLTNVGSLPEKAYFMFAPLKIRGCHGGPGRAIALY